MRPLDAERVEHRKNIVAGAILRITLDLLRHLRRRVTPGVIGDAAMPPREVAHLRLREPETLEKVTGKIVEIPVFRGLDEAPNDREKIRSGQPQLDSAKAIPSAFFCLRHRQVAIAAIRTAPAFLPLWVSSGVEEAT
jgi:hypothetical protein